MFRTETRKHHGTTYSVVAGTAADLPAALDLDRVPEHNREHAESMRIGDAKYTNHGVDFGGLRTVDDAVAIFTTTGWPEGEARARAEVARMPLGDMVPEATSMRRRRVIGDAGDDVRVEAALAGNWERAFESRARRATRQPVALSIGCAFGGPGHVSHREIFWTGVQMAALCDLLEGAGYRIELRALKLNQYPDGIHAQDWTVKHADQPLRWDTTLALFGHAGVYRTFGWAANHLTTLTVPEPGGVVLKGAEFLRHFTSLSSPSCGMVAPLSLVVPAAYDRDDALANLRTALAAVREGQAAAA
jgi:hypothetical protein